MGPLDTLALLQRGVVIAGGPFFTLSKVRKAPAIGQDELERLVIEARDPNTPRGRLWDLFLLGEVHVRLALIENPNICSMSEGGDLCVNLLDELAKFFPERVAESASFLMYAIIAPSEEMATVVLRIILKIADQALITKLYSNYGEAYWEIREAAASNCYTNPEILRSLGNEKTEYYFKVRRAVASNPYAPLDVLEVLSNSETESDPEIRSLATSRRKEIFDKNSGEC